ncbi:MAG TPA: hypothetical protein VIY90_04795 [Steroidobacteraceae bacterium]
MSELLRLYSQIALLRKGPQDVPAVGLLLLLTALGYFIVNALMVLLLPLPAGPWLRALLLDVVFTLAWYWALLHLFGRGARFVQTATAILGYRAVLTPLSLCSEWLVRRLGENDTWQLPVSVVYIIVLAWMVAASGRVLRAALDWPMPACVALVILELIAGWMLMFGLLPGLR